MQMTVNLVCAADTLAIRGVLSGANGCSSILLSTTVFKENNVISDYIRFIPSDQTSSLTLVDFQLDAQNSYLFTYNTFIKMGHAVAQLVETLRYKLEGCGFDSRWCHWNFSLT